MRPYVLLVSIAAAACAEDTAGGPPVRADYVPVAFDVRVEAPSGTEVALIPLRFADDGSVAWVGGALDTVFIEDGTAHFELPESAPAKHRDPEGRMVTVTYGVFALARNSEGTFTEYVAVGDELLAYVSAYRAPVESGWYSLSTDDAGEHVYADIAAGMTLDASMEPTRELTISGAPGSLPDSEEAPIQLAFFDLHGRQTGISAEVTGMWSVTFSDTAESTAAHTLGFPTINLIPNVFIDLDNSGQWSRTDEVVATVCAGRDELLVLQVPTPTDPAVAWAIHSAEMSVGWGLYSERENGLHQLSGEEAGGFMLRADCTEGV